MQVHKRFLYRLVTSGWRDGLLLKGDRILLVRLRYSPAVGSDEYAGLASPEKLLHTR